MYCSKPGDGKMTTQKLILCDNNYYLASADDFCGQIN